MEIERHFIKEKLESGEIFVHVSTTKQLADVLTNGLYNQDFEDMLVKLGMIDIYAPTWRGVSSIVNNN